MFYSQKLSLELYPVLFADCIPVKGALRSVIYDLTKSEFIYIPNILFELLVEHKEKNIQQLIKLYGNENRDSIIKYYNYLLKKNYIFFSKEPQIFPSINELHEISSEINNVIIDFSVDFLGYYQRVIKELSENYGCKHFQIRVFKEIGLNTLCDFLSYFDDTRVVSIELLVKYSSKTTIDEFISIVGQFGRITRVVIHSLFDDVIQNEITKLGEVYPVTYTEKSIGSENECGVVSTKYFSINIPAFTESKCFNSCLNRKVSIDTHGNIKNCPSMEKTYGNIKACSLYEILNETSGFKQIWDVSKDKIDVCKDCEYRYICIDCRAYLKEQKNIYSQPLKCNYNPYIAKWKGEEGFISVEEWKIENSLS